MRTFTFSRREIEIGGKWWQNERCIDKVMDSENGPTRHGFSTPQRRESNFYSHLFKLFGIVDETFYGDFMCWFILRVRAVPVCIGQAIYMCIPSNSVLVMRLVSERTWSRRAVYTVSYSHYMRQSYSEYVRRMPIWNAPCLVPTS